MSQFSAGRQHRRDWRIATAAVAAVAAVGGAAAIAPHLTGHGAAEHARQAAYVSGDGGSGSSASGTAGQMCVFYSPGTWFGVELGHVGWAVMDPGTGQWVLGSGDGGHGNSSSVTDSSSTTSGSPSGTSANTSPGSKSSNGSSPSLSGTGQVAAPADPGVPQYNGDASKETVWVVRTTTFANVLQDFESFGWYSSYRCASTSGGDANAAYTTAVNDGSFSLIGNNCLNHAWAALNAYEPGLLKPAPLTPNGWFSNLGTTDGFGPIQTIASGAPGGSALPSGS